MTAPIAAMNRAEIELALAQKTHIGFSSTATSNASDTASLLDSLELGEGGTNEFQGWRGKMISGTAGNIGDKFRVSSSISGDATITPAVTGAIQADDGYILLEPGNTFDRLESMVNDAIRGVMGICCKKKEAHTAFTESDKYQYDCLSGYVGVSKVEYVSEIATEVEIDDCDSAWTAGANVTATADSSVKQEGSYSAKLVVAAGAGATAVLAYNTFSAKDLSGCTEIEVSIYPTVALTAGQWQIRLDDTAGGGSAVESLDIPASSANVWTRHTITLANPLSDTAVVRVELYQVSDVGACTAYLDYILAVKATSRVYKEIPSIHWDVIREGTTNYIKLTPDALSLAGENTLLRVTGYQKPTELSDDSTDADVDPDYIIKRVAADIMASDMKIRNMDIKDRADKFTIFERQAKEKLQEIATVPEQGTRWCAWV